MNVGELKGGYVLNKQEVEQFEKVHAQLQALFEEVSATSKKKPDDALNKFKLQLVNQVLASANSVVGDRYRPFGNFTHFEEDAIPTNSDVAMMLSQYLSCLEELRADNITVSVSRWYWIVSGEQSEIRTGPPKKIGE